MAFDMLGKSTNKDKVLSGYKDKNGDTITIKASDMNDTLNNSLLFGRENIDWYNKFIPFGYLDPYITYTPHRQYLFFTKPDLNIFGSGGDAGYIEAGHDQRTDYASLTMNPALKQYPIFREAEDKYKPILTQLQYSVKGSNNMFNPFMCILSNACTSKLDLPGISAEVNESTTNMLGTGIQYRSHSYKSDNGYDFTLSFTDTKYLEIYMLAKLYDEYMRLQKMGKVAPKKSHITNKILSDQFSIYKFIVGEDGETILFFAKITGVFITDVPRSDMGDPGDDGFKYSLSFHGQFPSDVNPIYINEFNALSKYYMNLNDSEGKYMKLYNKNVGYVNNKWCSLPYIETVGIDDLRVAQQKRDGFGDYAYRLKWIL